MKTTCPAADASTGQLFRAYLVRVSYIKDGKPKIQGGGVVTGLTSHRDGATVEAFPLHLVLLLYACQWNSWGMELADITVSDQSENQTHVLQVNPHRAQRERGAPGQLGLF